MADLESNSKDQEHEQDQMHGQSAEDGQGKDRLSGQADGEQFAKGGQSKVQRSIFRKIVNVFIGIFLGLILLTIILAGFTQTKTFRELLREKVITIANEELNGKLNIEMIDGTVLTSLFLRNVTITVDNDTLLSARNIEVKTSPLQLLLKKIFIRQLLIENVKIAMLQDQAGEWNFAKLIKPTPEDTAKSSFSYLIHVNDIQFHNISFIKQSFSNLNSHRDYSTLNEDDLRIENLNFSAQAFADIQNSNYLLVLKELSFRPNLTRFNLKYISGEFAITKEFASISNFYFLSDSSEININARLDSLDLFGGADLKDFKNYPISFEAKAKSFNFDDISSFISSTELLKGSPSLDLKVRGRFGNFKIDKFSVDFRDTHFEIEGNVQNLNRPENLYITARIINTDINYRDINSLLPSLELPEYAKLLLSNVNMEFEGEPTKFKSRFSGNIEDGQLTCEVTMNLSSSPATYDISFATNNLNLYPVINTTTSLNSKGTIKGKGFSPADILADFYFNATGSTFDDYDIDKLTLYSQAADRLINLKIEGASDKLTTLITGDISFDKDTIPSFSLVGQLNNLDLAKFLKDEKYESNFNFYLTASGRNFNPDDLTATINIGIDSSSFQGKKISSSNIECTFKKDSTNREILLTSDFVDFQIDGSFSLSKAVEFVSYEAKTISEIIALKIDELNPMSIIQSSSENESRNTFIPIIANENLKFNFGGTFKDLELLSKLIGYDRLDLSGDFKGSIKNEAGNFSVTTQLNLDYFIMMQKGQTIYLSDFNAAINFTRDNSYLSFDKLFGTASLTGKRFYSGSNVKAIEADITFNQSKLFFSAAANIADMFNTEAEGIILMTPREQQLLVDRISFNYEGFEWINKDTMKVMFNPDYFKIVQLQMQKDTSLVSLSGIIESSGKQDLIITADRISGDIFERYFLGLRDNQLRANASVTAKINGEIQNPIINLDIKIKDVKLPTTPSANIHGNMYYADKKLSTNFTFLDSTSNETEPLFSLSGTLPINLSFATVKERLPQNEPLSIIIKSSQFNLSSLGRIVPGIADQSGILSTDLNIIGTFNSPEYSGFINLKDGAFRFPYNNLDYKCEMKLRFENQSMNVDKFILSNAGGTKYSGSINGWGGIDFDGFNTKEIKLLFNGDLAVLGQKSQIVSPSFYGDLLIGTDGDWLLSKNGDRVFFNGNILMKNTDLVYTTSENNTGVDNKNFNFIFIADSSKIDTELARFQQILLNEKDLQRTVEESGKQMNFDYKIGIRTENRAKAVIILSQAVNQKLFVEMSGDLKYSNFSGETRAQGAFELLEGSKLEFIKTFEAAGFLRFESDITNPYLDIVATYTNDYINPRDESGAPEEVAVKIKIRSPLSELGKSLAGNTESMGVYVGSKNIQNNVRESRYDYADAFSFIFIGKFKDDLTAQDKNQVAGETNLIGNTATSFLGSVLTNFVNSAVGDLVNNIQINQTAYATKLSLSGRYQNLRYTFGGTTDVFQNIGKASLKLEYLFNPKFLIRLERKDPITAAFGSEDKISELALKYKFEF